MWRTSLLLLLSISTAASQSLLGAVFNAIREGANQVDNEPADQKNLINTYDFIIVGAGTAGCALANRLTENPEWMVLLIEAGQPENFIMDYPLLASYLQFTDANWKYKTMPSDTSCLGLDNNQCLWPRGKVVGGSSVLNYMIHTRGNKKDYDNWEAMGNEGWGWDNALHYFKKMENLDIPVLAANKKMHSTDGHVSVSYAPYRTKIADAVMEAARDMNFPLVDYNGETQIGYSYLQLHLRNGTRASSSRSYLHPIRDRPNLHVKKLSEVNKILIDPATKTAFGVEFVSGGNTRKVFASREVIVSAGAINSPKLLMLSGIGPKKELKRLRIPMLANLRVGYNLMDHITIGGLIFMIDKPYSLTTLKIINNRTALIDYLYYHQGPISIAGGCEVIAFYDLKNPGDPDGHPDLELLFQGGSIVSDPLLRKNFGIRDQLYDQIYKPIEGEESWMVWPMLLLPKSKGRIILRDANPRSKPLIFSNYLTHPDDVKVLVEGVQKVLELVEMPSFKKMGTRLHTLPIPECEPYGYGTYNYWECQARHLTFTIYHYCGTAKMGPRWDKTAVVDPRLRVYGINRLRVIDASIMPMIPSAHTNTPTYMIAEKGADMIKQDWLGNNL